MKGRIPKTFIDELLTRVDIVTVIEQHLSLKKGGANYQALCPFHHEKSPSFTVSPSKQFYHCFGCGANGNAITFLMEHDRLDFVDAIETLASQAGLEVPYENASHDQASRPDNSALYDLMSKAATFYESQLKQPHGKVAIEYLKKRGLSGEIVKQFGVGFAPDGWENLLSFIGNQSENRQQLLTAGMLIKKESQKFYDRFRNRIMFPIRDRRGRVIAFGGRVLDDSKPKYLNSPETPIFHKGSELYGLYEARQYSRNLSRVLIVEGYMDVVALTQHDIHYAVATLGTATSAHHIQQLFRLSPEIVFCFDGDPAGQKAAWHALEILLPLLKDGWQVKFMFLPEGEDPDSSVRKEGKAAFENRMEHANTLSDFFFEKLAQQINLKSLEGRARLASLAIPYIQKIQAAVMRDLLMEKLAKVTQLSTTQLKQHVGQQTSNTTIQKNNIIPQRNKLSPVRRAITLLLQAPWLANHMQINLPALELPGMPLLKELVTLIQASDKNHLLTTGSILEYWRDKPEAEHLSKLATQEVKLSEDGLISELRDTLQTLQQQTHQSSIDELMAKAAQSALTQEEKETLQTLLRERQRQD